MTKLIRSSAASHLSSSWIHPSRAIAARRGVIGIVGSDQLAQQIVGIADRLDAVADAGDVATVVIGVGQRRAGLSNGLHQRRSAARAVAASQIAVGRSHSRATLIDRPLGDTLDTVGRVQSTTAFLYRGIIERYPVGLTLAF